MPAAQPGEDQVIGQRRVLRKGRPVQVGPDRIAVDAALQPVLGVVAATGEHRAQWLGTAVQVCPAAVVLEADEHPVAPADDEVADRADTARPGNGVQPGPGLRGPVDGVRAEDAEPGQLLAGRGAVVMPPELVAGADSEGGRPVLDRPPDPLALDVQQVIAYQALMGVSAAADQEQVEQLRIDPAAQLQVVHLDVDPTPAAAHQHGHHVAAITVLAHHARVQVSHGELHRAAPSSRWECRQNGASTPLRTSSPRSAQSAV
jgi:hypothetical protein